MDTGIWILLGFIIFYAAVMVVVLGFCKVSGDAEDPRRRRPQKKMEGRNEIPRDESLPSRSLPVNRNRRKPEQS